MNGYHSSLSKRYSEFESRMGRHRLEVCEWTVLDWETLAYIKTVEAVPTKRNRREIWRVNHSGSGFVLKTKGTLTGMEFDSASPPPLL